MLKSILGQRLLLQLAADGNTGGNSSNPSDDNGQDSSTANTDGNNTDDAEGDQGDQSGDGADSSADTAGDKQADDQNNDQQQADDGSAKVDDKPDDAKDDFQSHPRFKELIDQKNAAQQELEALKPQAARINALDQFMQQNGIRQDQLQQALEYLRHLNNDPAKAYEVLKPTFDKLAQFTGAVLPSDLAEKVASGVLSDGDAKEIARARAQQMHQSYQQQNQGISQQQQLTQFVDQTISTWAQSKMALDVDLKPGTPRWQYMDMAIKNARYANPAMQPQEALQLVERVYVDATKMFRTQRAVAPAKKPGLKSSNNNNGNASQVVKTAEDVVRAIQAGKRPHELKYS